MFRKKKIKRRLTESQEFEFLKVIVDKFLTLGTLLIIGGLFLLAFPNIPQLYSMTLFFGGLVVLLLFVVLILTHYEVIWA